jgi:hypothetical protein
MYLTNPTQTCKTFQAVSSVSIIKSKPPENVEYTAPPADITLSQLEKYNFSGKRKNHRPG